MPNNATCEGDSSANNVIGKGGVHYKKHGGFCLETQKYADAVHHVKRKLYFSHLHIFTYFLPTHYFSLF